MKIDTKMISDEVVEAAYNAYWHEKPNSGFREAIAAALSAWNGVRVLGELNEPISLYLPLPQEASDEAQ